MQTKSRYEVIADLEEKRRNLIKQRDGLYASKNFLEDELIKLEREKEDYIRTIDREIVDKRKELERFEENMEAQKETLQELIQSLDQNLERFSAQK